ncbi:MAG TPA: type II secretion system F family protein [Rhodocyclaceae bacterium]|nr:type II secretion system F family protein [Rhodocyclaceae bacterium]
MPSFAYVARDRSGSRIEGVMEGATTAAVASRIAETGATPVKIELTSDGNEGATGGSGVSMFAPAVPALEVMMFCRQMNTLLKAGVPILRALAGLVDSIVNKRFKAIVADVKESLESGRELSVAMGLHERVFSPFMVAMIRVGESTGRLEEVFLRLYHHLDFQKFMREQVKAALRYPSFVVMAMLVAITVINVFVIPAFAKTFKGLGAELPLMTRILIASSNFTVNWWPVLLTTVVVAAFAFRAFTRSEKGGFIWDRTKLRLPIAGSIIRQATYARFCRSLGLALTSGVSIVQSLSLVQQVVENRYIADKLEQMRMSVARGESVLRAATLANIFNPTVLQMIMVGEESGLLDEMLMEVADLFQQDVEYELKSLSSKIEPILIVILGVIVLILALGIFMPMWEMGRAMGGSH